MPDTPQDATALTAGGDEAHARNGMVAASQPLAARVGVDILEAGGNAVDAAVAVNAMLGLVEPHMNGIGGDMFALIWNAAGQELHALNATGRSGHEFNRRTIEDAGLSNVPGSGPLSWTVPGAVDGWAQMLERFGSLSIAEVLAPAIEHARRGFVVTEVIARNWRGTESSLRRWPDSAATYLPGGRAPRAGEEFRNPRLASSYELIAAGGRDAFYRGPLADDIVAWGRANGAVLSRRDFAEHSSTWVEPISTSYRGFDVWQLPPNSHGITALLMLNIMEAFDLAAMGPVSADAWHVMIEAKKLAFADRNEYVADPEVAEIPVDRLISKSHGRRRAESVDLGRAAAEVEPSRWDDRLEKGDTVYFTVVDRHGNAASMIESIFSSFGSKVVPGAVGFAMQNRASGFSMQPGHRNEIGSGRRCLHTNMPGMVMKNGRPWLAYGVMGGNMQPQGHAQVLANIIDFGMDVQRAGDAPRFRHQPDNSAALARTHGGTVLLEGGVPDELAGELQRRGHEVRWAGGGSMGGYQAILIDAETGALRGGSDRRKDGAALGY